MFKKNNLLRSVFLTFVSLLIAAFLVLGCAGCPHAQSLPAARGIETLIDSRYVQIRGTTQIVYPTGNVHTDISALTMADAGYTPGDLVYLTIGTFNGTVPFVQSYTDVSRGSPLIGITLEKLGVSINYGNFSEKYAVPKDSPIPVTIGMAKKGGYLADMEIIHLKKSDNRDDYASDVVFANFRAVSLGVIPPALLFRSCHPALGDARAPYAAELAEQANIVTIINLANTLPEVTEKAANVPWYASRIESGNVVGLAMGVDFASPEFRAKLRTGIQFMLNHDGPYLIHCNEGKDRTGYVSALFEALMGATIDQIIEDYMVTYVNYFGFTKDEPRYKIVSQVMLDILTEMNGGKPITDKTVQKAAERCLLTQIGLTKAEVTVLKEKLSG